MYVGDSGPTMDRGTEPCDMDVAKTSYDRRLDVMGGHYGQNECRPRKMDILREYEIRIRFLDVGCIVCVGCKDIAFSDIKDAMHELRMYVENPYDQGKKWTSIFEKQD